MDRTVSSVEISSPAVLTAIAIKCSRIGGMERYARELSRQLGDHGWRSVLCFLSLPDGEVKDFLALPNVVIEELPDLAKQGWPAIRQLRRMIHRHRPRIVHLQFTPFLSPLPWAARLWGADKVFFTDHGSHPEGTVPQAAAPWKRALGQILTTPYAKAISVSEFNRRMVATRGFISENRTCCIYNGTTTAAPLDAAASGAAFRLRYNIAPDRIVVVQVSWMIPEKGIGDLLQAAAIAIRSDPRLHFVLVGEGSQRESYTRQAEQLGVHGHITWTGLICDPFEEGVFAAADIVCQMSRWEEAFGLVIVEAMAFGKPIVATRVGGIPEIVRDNENGYLVTRGDFQSMAQCFVELAADAELRRQFGETGRATVTQFDIRKKVSQLLKLYGIGGNEPMVE